MLRNSWIRRCDRWNHTTPHHTTPQVFGPRTCFTSFLHFSLILAFFFQNFFFLVFSFHFFSTYFPPRRPKRQSKKQQHPKTVTIAIVKDNDSAKAPKTQVTRHITPITEDTTTQEPTKPKPRVSDFPTSFAFNNRQSVPRRPKGQIHETTPPKRQRNVTSQEGRHGDAAPPSKTHSQK